MLVPEELCDGTCVLQSGQFIREVDRPATARVVLSGVSHVLSPVLGRKDPADYREPVRWHLW
jgi:hypothetical protein